MSEPFFNHLIVLFLKVSFHGVGFFDFGGGIMDVIVISAPRGLPLMYGNDFSS